MLVKLQIWARANPLMLLALAAVCGILPVEWGWLNAHATWLPVLAAALLIAALFGGRFRLLLPGTALVFAFVHSVRTDETFRHPLRIALQSQDNPLPAIIRGSLLPDFDTKMDKRTHAFCTTSEIEIPTAGVVIKQASTVMVRLPKGIRFPGAGVFELHGQISLPRSASNPGTFDAQQYSLRMGRVARFETDHMRRISDSSDSLWCSFLEAAEDCRQWISRQLTQDLEDDPETTAVIRAMALGMSAEADDDIEDAFRNSGTLHVFAVSGLQVGLLGLIMLKVLRQFGVRHGLSLWVMIFVVFTYAFVTGWRPSGARAAFMVTLFMSSSLLDRESSLANSLGAAALLLLATDTHQLFMPGFQLSFGVLWFSTIGSEPLLKKLLPFTRLDPFLPPQLANWRQRAWSWSRLSVARTLSVSVAAWIGSLPFILGHFQSMTPVAVIANCVLVPLSTFCLGATCMSLIAALFHFSGAQLIFNNVNWAMAKAMIFSATWFAGLPGANFHLELNSFGTRSPATWTLLELPRGGAANHLRLGGEHWLFDKGDEASFRRTLRPYLYSRGVDSIQGVFLSHNDADHIGALPQVITTFAPHELLCSTLEPGRYDSARSTLRRLLDQPHPPLLRKLAADDRVTLSESKELKVDAQILYPSMLLQNDRSDDRAMVLMLHVGRWRVLWLSDSGWSTEKALCAGNTDLSCDILIRSQHEMDRSMTAEFLLKASPQAILCSSDARNAEVALPHSLVQQAREQNVPLWDAWKMGSIDLQFQQDELHVIATRGGQRLVLKPR